MTFQRESNIKKTSDAFVKYHSSGAVGTGIKRHLFSVEDGTELNVVKPIQDWGRDHEYSRLTLERELRDLLGAGRNARIAARYYGFDGRGGETLQAIGNEFGLTREHVRQIVTAASKRLNTGRPVSPTLDQTIASAVDRMPAASGEIEAELRFEGLTSGLFRVEYMVAAVFGH